MRALVVLVALSGTASADVAVDFLGQATRYGGQPNRNFGASVELSLDRARWQYFTELGMAGVSFGPDFADGYAGTMVRAGVGARYVARRFAIARMSFDLGFEAVAALQDIEWENGERDTRPELGAGFSWTFVFPNRIGVRTSVRAFVTPAPTSELACRGPCPTTDDLTSGYMLLTGVAW